MLKFFHSPVSPWSRKVHHFLEESGHSYDLHVLQLDKGHQRSADFMERNPYGRVPAIELEGFQLAESNAILRYLADRWQLSNLWPQQPQTRAQVDQWIEYSTHHLNKPIFDVAWNRLWCTRYGYKPDESVVEAALKKLIRDLPVVEKHLQGRHYLVTHELTLADISLACSVCYMAEAGIAMNDFPSLDRWLKTITARPAWTRMAALGI